MILINSCLSKAVLHCTTIAFIALFLHLGFLVNHRTSQ